MNSVKLTINKREIEFHFGLYFLGELLEELDISFDEMNIKLNKNPFKFVPQLMYISAKYAYTRKSEVIDFDMFTLVDWIEEDGGFANDNISNFLSSFTSSLSKDVPKEDNTKSVNKTKKK